ncbi:hypothetical protein [Photobacterium kishitanii]|uniref:Uncharacterized protein n=1 Tax=Photobacterium kishitanii TaxID=318456 RepID=A0A2T3KLG4_9GAMM|nr:hypothetical protein [Photobacterium kishitanii]PSV00516.1 hypothetical protein C9J27_05120 [Photobacterium kishitanii]
MFRSKRNEILNCFHGGEWAALVTEQFLMEMGCNINDTLYVSPSKMKTSDLNKIGFDDKTPTFVIQHSEGLEVVPIDFTSLELSNHFLMAPFDSFIIEREPNSMLNDNGDVFESFRQLTAYNRLDDAPNGNSVWEISSMNIADRPACTGLPRCLVNPVKCIVEVGTCGSVLTPHFVCNYSFENKMTSLSLLSTLQDEVASIPINHKNSDLLINGTLSFAAKISVWRDGLFDLIHLTRLLEANNIEKTTVSAPKLPPKEKKGKGQKYNRHNDFIVLSVKNRSAEQKRTARESSGDGTPKRPHHRRGHMRTLASGVKTYVSPSFIKGGDAVGQEYII